MTTRTSQPLSRCLTALNYGTVNKSALYSIVLYCSCYFVIKEITKRSKRLFFLCILDTRVYRLCTLSNHCENYEHVVSSHIFTLYSAAKCALNVAKNYRESNVLRNMLLVRESERP